MKIKEKDCLFCKIINKEIPVKIIYEDEEVLAILDVNPINLGHTLLIPKEHYKNIIEKEDNVDLVAKIKKIIPTMQTEYGFTDFKLVNNNGIKSGQEIFHFHFHLIPYYE